MVRFNHPQIGMTEFYEVNDLSVDDYVIKSDITKRKKYYIPTVLNKPPMAAY